MGDWQVRKTPIYPCPIETQDRFRFWSLFRIARNEKFVSLGEFLYSPLLSHEPMAMVNTLSTSSVKATDEALAESPRSPMKSFIQTIPLQHPGEWKEAAL